MTAKHSLAGAASRPLTDWHAIQWRAAHQNVRRLQARIVKATREGRHGKVKALQWLLTHSFSGKAIAVKRVTENQGKRTPGVDGQCWSTPATKAKALQQLHRRGYRAQPLRRVYIPKSNGQRRPLGIPTMKDRAQQALYLLALDPVAETTGDLNSYGFRTGRSTADALRQSFELLRRPTSGAWIWEGDIRSCFEQISHTWLLDHIPMDKAMLRQWLKAGFLENGVWAPTEAGTPQGGIISPTLMNLTLDGLEERIKALCPARLRAKGTKLAIVRYADDVRHITRRQIPFAERRGTEEQTSGSTAYPLVKAKRNTSMPLTREETEDVYVPVLQDPRNMVKAGLLEAQSPVMKAYILRHNVYGRSHRDRMAKSSSSEPSA